MGAGEEADCCSCQDGDDDGEVGEEVPDATGEVARVAKVLEGVGDCEGAGEEHQGHQEYVGLEVTICPDLQKNFF